MKALHVIPGIASRYGGPSQVVIEMAHALAARGMDVEVCTTDADGPDRLAVQLGRPVDYRGVQCHFFARQWSESYKYSGALAAWLRNNVSQFDVVHIHAVFNHSTYAAASACRRHRVPFVVRPLGTLDPWSFRQKQIRKWIMWHSCFQRCLRNAAAIHYTTEDEKRLAESFFKLDHGVVIPNGVAIPSSSGSCNFRRKLGISDGAPFILTLSRLHSKKGLEYLLKAFFECKRMGELADWHLVLAGEGDSDYVSELKRLAHGSEFASRVHWPGWLNGDIKQSALREAALFAQPSFQENFGISVAEAMACGTSVLVTPGVNLAGDIRTANAGWVSELDVSKLRSALNDIAKNPSERRARGEAGRQLVHRKFTWQRVARDLESLYNHVITRSDSLA